MTTHSDKWQTARAKRAARRAADPKVQARARAHVIREQSRIERARRAAHVDEVLAAHGIQAAS